MLDKPPPGRYRVIERDRRLITIDTWSGQECGTASSSESASLESRSTRLGAGPQASGNSRSANGSTASQASAAASTTSSSKPGPWGKAPSSLAATERQTRIIGLAFARLAIGAVLILTHLWIPALVILLVPQIRNPLWAATKPALTRYLGGR